MSSKILKNFISNNYPALEGPLNTIFILIVYITNSMSKFASRYYTYTTYTAPMATFPVASFAPTQTVTPTVYQTYTYTASNTSEMPVFPQETPITNEVQAPAITIIVPALQLEPLNSADDVRDESIETDLDNLAAYLNTHVETTEEQVCITCANPPIPSTPAARLDAFERSLLPDYSTLSLTQLRYTCKMLELPQKGDKNALLQRLKEAGWALN